MRPLTVVHWLALQAVVHLLRCRLVNSLPFIDQSFSCPPLPNPDHRCQLCVYDHTVDCPKEFRCGDPSFQVCPDGNCYPADFECEIEYGSEHDPCESRCAESCAATVFKTPEQCELDYAEQIQFTKEYTFCYEDPPASVRPFVCLICYLM